MNIPGRVLWGIHIPPSVWRDALLLPTVFLFNCFLFSSWRQLTDVTTNPWLILVWLYGLIGLLPLFWRERAPILVFTLQCVLTVLAWPILPQYTPVVGIPISLHAVAAHRSRRVALLALLASFLPNTVAASVALRVQPNLADGITSFIPNIIFLVLVTASAWGAGRVTKATRRQVRQLERERVATREAVVAERARIARELHDSVSHAVTVIVLQAAGAARVAETDFAQVVTCLNHIEVTGKQAMAELRRMLGVLQANDSGDGTIDELGPQPGLADLPMLLNSLRTTGIQVAVCAEGTPLDLDPSVDLAAYRIVQEGLTNVLKHAGRHSTPALRLRWVTENLLIEIDNHTEPAPSPPVQALSTGRGLIGLHERVTAVGGHLHAGPHQNGYRLTASLPLTGSAQQVLADHGR